MPGPSDGAERLLTMTEGVAVGDLAPMVLGKADLPDELGAFHSLEDRSIENESLRKASNERLTMASLELAGRISGFGRAFAVTPGAPTLAAEPAELLQAETSVHLFTRPEYARRWIDDEFVAGLRGQVGSEDPEGRRITGVEILTAKGFFSHSAALLVVHELPGGLLATTVIDFQLGCLLGEASVIAKVDKPFLDLATDLGRRLERQMVRVILDG